MISLKTIFSAECKFVAGAASIEQIPNNLYIPEVAFVGRSNVGKSSLINAIVRNRECAKVSKMPGKTQQINFFNIMDKISIVDLPGYGYAAVSKKMRKQWGHLILDYLRGRQNLKRAFLLIDSRHGVKDSDSQIMDILDEAAVVYQIVLTKIDKAAGVENIAEKVRREIIANHIAAYPKVISTSAEKGLGIDDVQAEIMNFIN